MGSAPSRVPSPDPLPLPPLSRAAGLVGADARGPAERRGELLHAEVPVPVREREGQPREDLHLARRRGSGRCRSQTVGLFLHTIST